MESSDEEAIAALCVIAKIQSRRRARKRQSRSMWVLEWLQSRSTRGAYNSLLQELKLTDVNGYRNFLRMNETSFNLLCEKVKPLLQRQDTHMRSSIPSEERLALTLRWLATGKEFIKTIELILYFMFIYKTLLHCTC